MQYVAKNHPAAFGERIHLMYESSAAAQSMPASFDAPPLSPVKLATKQQTFTLVVNLTSGTPVTVGDFDSRESAIEKGEALATEIDGGAWPMIGGTMIRPEAIISVEVTAS
jgi:hypothetical protein